MNRKAAKAQRLIAERRAVKVIVTQDDGTAFEGVIADLDDGWLLLKEAEQIGPQNSRVGVDGDLLLPRERIQYIQKP